MKAQVHIAEARTLARMTGSQLSKLSGVNQLRIMFAEIGSITLTTQELQAIWKTLSYKN